MNSKGSELALLSGFLVVLTSTSKKRIKSALVFIKNSVSEGFDEGNMKGCVSVLIALLESPDDISGLACEILLALTVENLTVVVNQCYNENSIYFITEACKRAVVNGLKHGAISELEEGLVILLQKLSGHEYLQSLIKQQGILELLVQRAQGVHENSFFSNNVNSIIRNLSN